MAREDVFFVVETAIARLVPALAAASVIASGAGQAEGASLKAGAAMGLDFNAGADPLVELEFSDGDDQTISGGNGIVLSAVASARFFEESTHRLECQVAAGMKLSTMVPTDNADLTHLRLPLELLAFYRNDSNYFRVGGGIYFSPVNSLTGSGALDELDVQFDAALGAIVQADLAFEKGWVGLRYTRLDYSAPAGSDAIAANSLGLTFGFYGLLSRW